MNESRNFEEIREVYKEALDRFEEQVNDWWSRQDDEQKLFAAYKITQFYHRALKDGATYRYLIYDIMGFGPEAYAPLQVAGGIEINNSFVELICSCGDIFYTPKDFYEHYRDIHTDDAIFGLEDV